MSFAEKGAVADIDPAFFVGYLHRVKATGTLKFEDAPTQRAIYFRDGRVLFSSSNAPEDQLGAILVAGGKISQEQFDALVAALEPKQSIAAALAQGGHVSQRDIGDAARRKVEQIVGACCAQTTGRYEFEDGVLPKGALDLKLTTEKVLVAAFEALEPSGFLIRILKSPMAVLAAAPDIEPTEAELVRLRGALDGFSSLPDIGGQVGLSPAATEVRAAVLVVMGAATVVTSQIEEMALPDTGETISEAMPEMTLSEAAEPIEAETLSFAPSFTDPEPPASPDATLSDAALSEATLMMSAPPQQPSFEPNAGEATMVMGSGLDLLEPPPPRTTPVGGQKRARANTGDLAAVKDLLGSSDAPRPPAASIPSRPWEPVLSAASRPGRNRDGLAGLMRNPIAQRVAGGILLLALATLGWIGYTTMSAPPATPSAAVQPTAAVPVPATSAASQPAPLAAPSQAATAPPAAGSVSPAPVGATSPAVAAAAAKPGTGAPAAPSPTVAVTPIPPTGPKTAAAAQTPAPSATPSPSPASAVAKVSPPPAVKTSPTPTPAPVAARPAPAQPNAAGGAAPLDAMKAGRLDEASLGFERIARSRSAEFSVQILVACSAQTIEKAMQNDPSADLFILSATFANKPCHRLMRGFFKTSGEAAQAVSSLPPYYTAEGAKPRAVPLKSILK